MAMELKNLILDENGCAISCAEGVLCQVVINGAEQMAYLPVNALQSLGVEVSDVVQGELCSEEKGEEGKACSQEESPNSSHTRPAVLPVCNSVQPNKSWTDGETKMLLDLYASNLEEVGPFKKFKTKKAMWEFVASKITEELKVYVSWAQCETRFKTVKKRRSFAVSHNNTSGNNPVPVPYQDEIEKIKAVDDSIQPEVLASVGDIQILKNNKSKRLSESESDKTIKKKKNKEDIFLSTYREIQEAKERNRERRHQDKCNLLKEYLAKEK